jgi:hypothetical protein
MQYLQVLTTMLKTQLREKAVSMVTRGGCCVAGYTDSRFMSTMQVAKQHQKEGNVS